MKSFFFITVLNVQLLLYFSVFSQSNSIESKYWIWRDRLINDFMVPGNCAGCGIIFSSRGVCCGWGLDQNNLWGLGGFDIGDEGFEMGKYLAVLATEWKLLKNGGQSTVKTELELFYELKTIDRLDIMAEHYWHDHWGGADYSTSEPNGFMIRDDLFDNFLSDNSSTFGQDAFDRYNYLNQGGGVGKYVKQNILVKFGNDWDANHWVAPLSWLDDQWRNLAADANSGVSGAEACMHASDNYGHVTGPEEYSQDNYIGLMVGLVTIIKLLPNDVVILDPENCSGSMNIKQHAVDILSRIIHFMENSYTLYNNNNSETGRPYFHDGDPFSTCWTIYNPITGMCVKGVFWKAYLDNFGSGSHDYCNQGGSEATSFSCAFQDIYNEFVNNGSVGNCTICLIPYEVNNSMFPILKTISDNGSNANHTVTNWINNYYDSNKRSELQYLDLLYCLLYGGTSQRSTSYYSDYLSKFPCETYYDDLVLSNNKYGNLLSQMLTFNLLKLYLSEAYVFPQPVYQALNDYVSYPFPIYEAPEGIFMLGTDTYYESDIFTGTAPADYYSNNTLTSTSDISNYVSPAITLHGHVRYTAAEGIYLQQGFKVSDGAFFRARVDPLCKCEVKPEVISLLNPCPGILKSSFNNSTSNTSELTSIESTNKILIYPNPTSGIFFLSSSNENIMLSLEITNSIGDVIFIDNNYTKLTKFDLSGFPKGIYFIKAISTLGEAYFGKIVYQ